MAQAITFHKGALSHHVGPTVGAPGAFNAGYVENRAINAEHVADELGFIGSMASRIGLAAKHLWAAARLIVEPGLHVPGWSRAQAIGWLIANTALSRDEAAQEVDRYLTLAGQSFS